MNDNIQDVMGRLLSRVIGEKKGELSEGHSIYVNQIFQTEAGAFHVDGTIALSGGIYTFSGTSSIKP